MPPEQRPAPRSLREVCSPHLTQINATPVLVSKRHTISIFNYYTSHGKHGKVTQLSGISGWGKKKAREQGMYPAGEDKMEMNRPIQGDFADPLCSSFVW